MKRETISIRNGFAKPIVLIAVMMAISTSVLGQDSSLLRQPPPPDRSLSPLTQPSGTQPMQGNPYNQAQSPSSSAAMLSGVSWTYQPPPQLRRFQKNDIIAIRVDEITRVMAEGAADSRKRTMYEALVSDWIRLDSFRVTPDPQQEGDPTVAAESNNQYRAESSVESRESMSFNIAATIVDIRPNGNLVLEARKTIRVNDNLWETSLSGICRAQDIAPDNVVLSRDVIDLEIRKEDQGHLRDGYKRGWFSRWFDRVQPF